MGRLFSSRITAPKDGHKYKGEIMMSNKKIILTGDRPTGKLHIGHYVGSLQNRV